MSVTEEKRKGYLESCQRHGVLTFMDCGNAHQGELVNTGWARAEAGTRRKEFLAAAEVQYLVHMQYLLHVEISAFVGMNCKECTA